MQGACYNQLATTPYTPAARLQSSKQHHACAVVFLCCIAVASHQYLVALFSDPAVCKAGGLCCCVIKCVLLQVHQHCRCCSAIFVGSRVWSRAPVPSCVHPFYFCKYHPTTVLQGSVCHARVRCVRVRCVQCVTRGVLPYIFFQSAVLDFVRERPSSP